jgi:hypothetical protein
VANSASQGLRISLDYKNEKGHFMATYAFHPEGIVSQIKSFFGDVHDLSGFYYKLYLLNRLCRNCDGRGYLQAPDQRCSQCQGSGSSDRWQKPTTAT